KNFILLLFFIFIWKLKNLCIGLNGKKLRNKKVETKKIIRCHSLEQIAEKFLCSKRTIKRMFSELREDVDMISIIVRILKNFC
ncbi:hypothetical protein, partial [Methylicorpusculum sp.]|uniref:hypothetical protein n=1 Tax=Methylicorpusculum sp. TaxID=2713644 RepID=UPI002ABB42AB